MKIPMISLSAALICTSMSAIAATDLEEIHLSSDIHATLPATGGGTLVFNDDAIAVYQEATGQADGFNFIGTLDASDVDGYHAADTCGPALFSVNSTAEVASTVMRPADVFRDNGSKVFDAAAEGVADGVNLDAVSREPSSCDLILSFDITVQLDGTVFRPADLIQFDGGSFSLFREGPSSGNLDAVHVLDNDSVLASFAAPVPNLGIAFADHDVIEQAGADGEWSLAFQPVAIDPSWDPADTDALYVVRAPIAGDFRWDRSQVEVLESAGSVSLTIERIGFAEGPVRVNFSTANGSAVGGVDYNSTSSNVVFSDSQLSASTSITVLDDAAVDGDKTFFVDLTSANNNAVLVNPTRITVLIRDDEDFIFADGFESN